MADFSIIQKLKLFFETVVSTPFFFLYAILGIILIVIMIIDIKKHKKISKILYFIVLTFLITFVLIKYFNLIIRVIDTFVDVIIKALYFPSIGLYITILLISNIMFFVIFLSKKFSKGYKVVSVVCNVIIDFMFIMILGIIAKNNIDITHDVKLYSDSTLLTLLQLSMGTFFSMYLLFLLIKVYHRFRIYDKVVTFDNEEYPDMGLYIKDNCASIGFPVSQIQVIKVIDFQSKDGQNE